MELHELAALHGSAKNEKSHTQRFWKGIQ